MEGKLIVGVVSIVVGIILVGSMLAPAIQMVSGGAWDETITTTYNEDPDLTFDRLTSDFALDITVTFGDDISIVNGEDTVTATFGPMFLLAADNSAVFINTADEIILVWTDTDGTQSVDLQGDFTAAIADGKLTIDDGTSYDLPLPTSYLYVPSSTGQYGSFPDGGLTKRAEDPVIAAGSFAGAVAYNSSVTLVGDAMVMSVDGTDTFITSAEWVAAPAAEPAIVPLDPSSITIQPLDPGVISLDPEPDVSIMTVPTPTYTDGDWGYDLITSGANQGKAKIVSYSGAGGGPITVPASVGGYDVAEFGIGQSGQTVFNTSLAATDLILSEGITVINSYALKSCTKFTGSLVLPNSLTKIGASSFSGCYGFTGSLVLPNSLTEIGNQSFRGCTGFTGSLIIPASITNITNGAFYQCTGFTGSLVILSKEMTIGNGAFEGCTGFKSLISLVDENSSLTTPFTDTTIEEVLNIGSLEITPSSYGLSADVLVQDYIGADVYIAPATITEVIHHSGGGGEYSGFYEIILVVTVVAILIAAAGLMIYRRSL